MIKEQQIKTGDIFIDYDGVYIAVNIYSMAFIYDGKSLVNKIFKDVKILDNDKELAKQLHEDIKIDDIADWSFRTGIRLNINVTDKNACYSNKVNIPPKRKKNG